VSPDFLSQETIAMSSKERERLVVLRRVESGEMALKEPHGKWALTSATNFVVLMA